MWRRRTVVLAAKAFLARDLLSTLFSASLKKKKEE